MAGDGRAEEHARDLARLGAQARLRHALHGPRGRVLGDQPRRLGATRGGGGGGLRRGRRQGPPVELAAARARPVLDAEHGRRQHVARQQRARRDQQLCGPAWRRGGRGAHVRQQARGPRQPHLCCKKVCRMKL